VLILIRPHSNFLETIKHGDKIMFNINTFFNSAETSRFFCPTQIFMGENSAHMIFDIIKKNEQVLVVADDFFQDNEFIKKIQQARNVFEILMISKPASKMPVDQIISTIPENLKWIIAIGGGSAIDTAKAIAASIIHGSYDNIGYGANRNIEYSLNKTKPLIISIPTTAGTGAETSRYYMLYDDITHEKIMGRSWSVVSNYTFLDPVFYKNASVKFMILYAFDAFIQLWESFICRYERSAFNEMLALDGIPRIINALDKIHKTQATSKENILQLQYAATMSGIAISNVRTGIIHEAAGALFEMFSLSHPETLSVFFENAIIQYSDAVLDKQNILIKAIKSFSHGIKINCFEELIILWKNLFDEYGISDNIHSVISSKETQAGNIKQKIVKRVMDDNVWVTKESPVPLTLSMVKKLVENSLAPYLKQRHPAKGIN